VLDEIYSSRISDTISLRTFFNSLLMGALVGLGTSAAFWLIVRNGIK